MLASLAGQAFADLALSLDPANQAGLEGQAVSSSLAESQAQQWATLVGPQPVVGQVSLGDFAGGEIVATHGSYAYSVLGRQLTEIHLGTGSVASIELPSDIVAVQLFSDGRILAMLEVAPASADAEPGPAAVVLSFASGEWEAVELADAGQGGESEPSGDQASSPPVVQWASAALARGDRGLLLAGVSAAHSDAALTLRSLQVDPSTFETISQPLAFQVSPGTRLLASPSGPLALISQPSEDGRRLSLWSTRAMAPVEGSELTLPGLAEVLDFDDASGLVVARETTGGIRLLDAANGFATLHRLSDWTGPVVFDAAREQLYGLLDGLTLNIFDVRTGRSVPSLPLDTSAATVVGGIALADAGNRLVLSTSAGISQIQLDRIHALRLQVQANAPTVDTLFEAYADQPLQQLSSTASYLSSSTGTSGPGTSSPGTSSTVESSSDTSSTVAPRIEPGAVTVWENELGAVIADLQITGLDGEQSGEFAVSDPRFVIEGSQLRLAPQYSLDYELEPIVRVEVTLTTGDSVLRHMLTINVANLDDPITDLGLDEYTLPERTPGYVVGPVRVMDQDSHDFELGVDDGRFEIVDGHLKLRTGVFVRRADQSEILLTVTASAADNPVPAFSKELILIVTANESQWHNGEDPTDVDRDGDTDPLDALLVINRLNGGGPGKLGEPIPYEGEEFYLYDVNGDGWITPIDALIVINELNRDSSGHAEYDDSPSLAGGEGEASLPDVRVETADPAPSLLADLSGGQSPAPPAAQTQTDRAAPDGVTPLAGPLAEDEDADDTAPAADGLRDEFFFGLGSNLS